MNDILADTKPLNRAEQAIKALNNEFDQLSDEAERLGLSLDAVEQKRIEKIQQLTTDFNESIRKQILALTDPLQFSLEEQERIAKERIENARTLGADLLKVEELNALERKRILEQQLGSFDQANKSILSFLTSLKTSSVGGLTISAQSSNADTVFNDLLAQARNDPQARAELASFLPGFVNLKRQEFGSTSQFFEFTSFLEKSLGNLVSSSDTRSELQNIGEAITTGDNAIVDTLREEVGALRAEIESLRNDMRLLVNA